MKIFNIFKNCLKKAAFTLAEVLIVVAIIGVVAAFTIPNLLNSANNQELVGLLKKNYSTLASGVQSLINENGCADCITGMSTAGGNACRVFATELYKYISTSKICSSDPVTNGCWHSDGLIKGLDGTSPADIIGSYYTGAVLSDGAFIVFYTDPTFNQNMSGGTGDARFVNSSYSSPAFLMDVNGAKPPNQIGRDIFYFYLTRTGIYPIGTANASYASSVWCTTTPGSVGNHAYSGVGCAGKVLSKNEMTY